MEYVKMRPLTEGQYAKTHFRQRMRELSFPEKVHCVIELQKRMAPILANRGISVKPWPDDGVWMKTRRSNSSRISSR